MNVLVRNNIRSKLKNSASEIGYYSYTTRCTLLPKKMKRILLLYIILLTTVNIYSQSDKNIKSIEQIAFDFFVKNILEKEYSNFKFFVFDGNLEIDSAIGYSSCMPLDRKFVDKRTDKDYRISVSYNNQIVKKLNFFNKLFTSKKKIGNIFIFKKYPFNDNFVVVVDFSTINADDFYSFLINPNNGKILDYCNRTMYE